MSILKDKKDRGTDSSKILRYFSMDETNKWSYYRIWISMKGYGKLSDQSAKARSIERLVTRWIETPRRKRDW
jgi:hypothetical protein